MDVNALVDQMPQGIGQNIRLVEDAHECRD
jgi:hypothetical protein